MRHCSSVLLASVLALLLVAPAQAITYGQLDGNRHPNVGSLLVDYAGDDEGPVQVCSGTLIAPTVFLTAAHCTVDLKPGDQAYVSLAQDVDPSPPLADLLSGTAYTNPAYNQKQSDPGDLAVVKLDNEVRGIAPAALPKLGLFDDMKAAGTLKQEDFTVVGYGVHEPERGGGPPRFAFDGMRWRSASTFNALNKAWLRLSQNPNTSQGGACYGDSGGPNFLGAGQDETDVIAAITVTGDSMCVATNVVYRLDTRPARAFLGAYVALP